MPARWRCGTVHLQKRPRAGRQALRSGGFCKSLRIFRPDADVCWRARLTGTSLKEGKRMNCSHCDFAAKIKEAEHGGIRYEDTPCASCKLTEDSSHTMAFDEARADREDVGGVDDGPDALRGG